jgi:hypothetical protein
VCVVVCEQQHSSQSAFSQSPSLSCSIVGVRSCIGMSTSPVSSLDSPSGFSSLHSHKMVFSVWPW